MKGLSLLMTKPCKKKTDGLKNKNTTKADAKAEKKFVTYLKKKGFQQEFWLIGKQELDKILCKFWFEIRTKNGEYYSWVVLKTEFCIRRAMNSTLYMNFHSKRVGKLSRQHVLN